MRRIANCFKCRVIRASATTLSGTARPLVSIFKRGISPQMRRARLPTHGGDTFAIGGRDRTRRLAALIAD